MLERATDQDEKLLILTSIIDLEPDFSDDDIIEKFLKYEDLMLELREINREGLDLEFDDDDDDLN